LGEQLILLFSGNPGEEVSGHGRIEPQQNRKQLIPVLLQEERPEIVARRESHLSGGLPIYLITIT
jgi:hypothetical protein